MPPQRIQLIVLCCFVPLLAAGGCGQRMAPSSRSTDGSPPTASTEPTPTAAQATLCDPRCLDEGDEGCVLAELPPVHDPEGLPEQACWQCLEDAHCAANPRAQGPRCDPQFRACGCDGDADCRDNARGLVCLGTGNSFVSGRRGICSCGELGPTPDCPVGTVCKYGRCDEPCRSDGECDDGVVGTNIFGQSMPSRRCDQRPSSPTYGLCVVCLTNSDCARGQQGPVCVRSNGQCGCELDADCDDQPWGRHCAMGCVHHAGPASCRSYCTCESNSDCGDGQSCHAEPWPRRCASSS